MSRFPLRRDQRGLGRTCDLCTGKKTPAKYQHGDSVLCQRHEELLRLIVASAKGPTRAALKHIGRPCANPRCTRGVIRKGAAYCSIACRKSKARRTAQARAVA